MHLTPAHMCLVFELPPNFAEGSVSDGTGKSVVFAHARNVEVFEHNRLEVFGYRRCCFVQSVTANIGNSPMDFRQGRAPPLYATTGFCASLLLGFLLPANVTVKPLDFLHPL